MTAKKIKLVALLFMLVILIGCAQEDSAEEVMEESETVSAFENDSAGIIAEDEIGAVTTLPLGACTAGWKCISSQIKAYRNESCGFGRRITCPLGCLNDTCRAASTCTSGFKCINDHRKGYQTEACTWINDVECPGGCEDGECLFYNTSAAEEAEAVAPPTRAEPSPPLDDSRTLRMGQQEMVEINNEEHVISLYILEQSRMKFSVDGFKTDWLEEGDTANIRGITLAVKEILFQSFSGGKQEVRYTVE